MHNDLDWRKPAAWLGGAVIERGDAVGVATPDNRFITTDSSGVPFRCRLKGNRRDDATRVVAY